MSLIQQKSHTGTDAPATEGGEDRWLDESPRIGKHFGRRIDQGGKYPLRCVSADNKADLFSVWKVASANVSRAKVSRLAAWACLEPISYQHLLLTPKPIAVG